MPWKRFCLFCLFHASLSIVDCSIQLVYTKFPNRVINRALRGAASVHHTPVISLQGIISPHTSALVLSAVDWDLSHSSAGSS